MADWNVLFNSGLFILDLLKYSFLRKVQRKYKIIETIDVQGKFTSAQTGQDELLLEMNLKVNMLNKAK